MKKIYENNKPITKIEVENALYVVGKLFSGVMVTEINPYLENGEMAAITWYCINFENGVELRINPRYIISVEF